MLSSELHLSALPHLNLQSCETDLYPRNKTTILKELEGDALSSLLCVQQAYQCALHLLCYHLKMVPIYIHVNMTQKNRQINAAYSSTGSCIKGDTICLQNENLCTE